MSFSTDYFNDGDCAECGNLLTLGDVVILPNNVCVCVKCSKDIEYRERMPRPTLACSHGGTFIIPIED